jgi:hypothetical protein
MPKPWFSKIFGAIGTFTKRIAEMREQNLMMEWENVP